MPPGNGSPVTWRELELSLAPLKDGLGEVRHEVAEMRAQIHAYSVLAESRSFLGSRGRSVVNALMVSVPAGLVGTVVSLLLTR